MSDGGPSARRLRALDGLRAVAVVAVLAYHGGVRWARGGFLGVDVFFVVSGYLITTLLLAEWERNGRLGLRAFWSRRARRLLPALLLLLVGVAVYARAATPPDTVTTTRHDALAALAYVANWRFILAGRSYFARSAAPSLLQHTWSLAIEEQFYLVWPLVLAAALRLRTRRSLLAGLTALAALGSAIEMGVLYRPGTDPSRVYFGTDTHAHGVLVGVTLALLVSRSRASTPAAGRRVWAAAGAAGLGVTVGAFLAVSASSPLLYRGGFAVIDLAAALLIGALVRQPHSVLSRALSVPPLPAIGAVSYGIYLWHWPVFLVLDQARVGLAGGPLLATRTAVTAILATVSYHVVEMPVRQARLPFSPGRLLAPAAIATALVVVVATSVTAPLPPRATVTRLASQVAQPPTTAAPAAGGRAIPETLGDGTPLRVLIEGDSVALTLGLGLSVNQSRYGLTIADRGMLGCGLARGDTVRDRGNVARLPAICSTWPTTWAADVDHVDPQVAVVLVGRWDVMDRVFDGRWTHIGDPSFDADLRAQLELAVRTLSIRGARVALLTMPCESEGGRPDGSRWPQDDPQRIGRFNGLLAQAAAQSGGVASVVDLSAIVCPNGRYATTFDGTQVRNSDGVHFTVEGGAWLSPRILPDLVRLGGGGPAT